MLCLSDELWNTLGGINILECLIDGFSHWLFLIRWALQHLFKQDPSVVVLHQRPVSLNWIQHVLVANIEYWDDIQLLICLINYSFRMVASVVHEEVDDLVVFGSLPDAPEHLDEGLFGEGVVYLFHCN